MTSATIKPVGSSGGEQAEGRGYGLVLFASVLEPELLALMALSANKNMIDKDEYPQTAEIEARGLVGQPAGGATRL